MGELFFSIIYIKQQQQKNTRSLLKQKRDRQNTGGQAIWIKYAILNGNFHSFAFSNLRMHENLSFHNKRLFWELEQTVKIIILFLMKNVKNWF